MGDRYWFYSKIIVSIWNRSDDCDFPYSMTANIKYELIRLDLI